MSGPAAPKKPDILLFLSDQHTGTVLGCAGDPVIRTPHLDALAADGVRLANAYTPYALCVPARASLLTGKMPYDTGVYLNGDCFNSHTPTFLHAFAAAGYETVLIGRMHFIGDDQSHGFTRRLVGDFCPNLWGRDHMHRAELGSYQGTNAEPGCLRKLGAAADSPVLEYDRAVLQAAEEYLSRPSEKPQLIVVGTYAPHFPYAAPAELVDYYRPRVPMPASAGGATRFPHAQYAHKEQYPDSDTAREARACYYAMVEQVDEQAGRLHALWKQRQGEKLFVYLSDHGDMLGEHDQFGKKCPFENAVRVPAIFCGDHIPRGSVIETPTSLVDIGTTLCAYAGIAPPPAACGLDVFDLPANRAVQGEMLLDVPQQDDPVYCRMVRRGPFKLVCYAGHPEWDTLFHLPSDPQECVDRKKDFPDCYASLRFLAFRDIDVPALLRQRRIRRQELQMLKEYGNAVDLPDVRFPFSGEY
ncbi:MAG: sulfatase-like hydrolase/transferase [Butyricicoccus sp.]